jgi:hypothetical protein
MTQEDVITMAREADLDWHTGWTLDDEAPNRFETFAKLVAQEVRDRIMFGSRDEWVLAEREACAQLAEEWLGPSKDKEIHIAKAIRERGQA